LGNTNFIEDKILGSNAAGSLGALIWKARDAGDNNFILTQDNITGVGPGCFVDQYTTDEIIQNLESITKEFGSNKQ